MSEHYVTVDKDQLGAILAYVVHSPDGTVLKRFPTTDGHEVARYLAWLMRDDLNAGIE